jgi:tRNA dimethylallyltransferase
MKIEEEISPILFIVGPTASGKSSLAMELARLYGGEIVCADSQTIRKSLDIGTAKPSRSDREEIPHHLLDIVAPYEPFSVIQFKYLAKGIIGDIQSRGKLPVIVGGTGLYINSLFFDFNISESVKNSDYKKALEKLSVYELQKIIIDKKYSMPNNDQNPRHLISLLLRDGRVFENNNPIPGALMFGLMPDDEILKQRIHDRIDIMFESGFVNEVKELIKNYGWPNRKMDAIGYPICMSYINGDMTLDEAKEMFRKSDWQYARRQKAWFKRNPYIKWFNTDKEALSTIRKEVETTLNKSVTIET